MYSSKTQSTRGTLAAKPISATGVLRVAYTPDSDDVINFYAWENGYLDLPGWEARFERHPIAALNRAAMAQRYDVVSISSVCYPRIADHYWILSAGSSIGRGYGPVLVSKEETSIERLRGKRIAVGGLNTTGSALAQMYCRGAELVEMPYDAIADAVLGGRVDAGVMIHEELLHFRQRGLARVCDLGRAWCDQTGVPLPVGLNVVHKRVGRDAAREVASICRRSLEWGLAHEQEAMGFAATFGREGCTARFIEMFSNADTLSMPADAEQALGLLFARVAALDIAPPLVAYEVIRDQ
jgi:1,4-dihydroxy-6-naphthoate synthase